MTKKEIEDIGTGFYRIAPTNGKPEFTVYIFDSEIFGNYKIFSCIYFFPGLDPMEDYLHSVNILSAERLELLTQSEIDNLKIIDNDRERSKGD